MIMPHQCAAPGPCFKIVWTPLFLWCKEHRAYVRELMESGLRDPRQAEDKTEGNPSAVAAKPRSAVGEGDMEALFPARGVKGPTTAHDGQQAKQSTEAT